MGRLIFMLLVLAMLAFICWALSKLLKRTRENKRKSFDEDIEAVAKRIKLNE
jgi:Na+-transporting methylmalonyl-CoA/oxaloacetate decarboxylase gamma subunit